MPRMEVIADLHIERLGGSMKRRRTIAIVAGLLCSGVLMLAGCVDKSAEPVATLHPVEVDGQWGYMNASGTVTVRPRFDQADDYHEGLASVTLKTGVGFIDTTGAVVYADDDSSGAACLSIGQFSEGLAAKVVRIPGEDPDTRVFYINRQGETAFTASFFGGRPFHGGLAPVQVNGMALMGTGAPEQWGYIGKDGAFVLEPQYESAGDFSGGLACVAVGDRHGYIDKTGRWVIELPDGTVPRTDWSAFSAGLAAVWQGDKAGYIDRHGTMVIAPRFFDARPFAEGLAAVRKGSSGLWGYIDKKGTMVIAPQFGQAEQFRGGVARVYLDRERTTLGYIDKTGKVVWQGKVTTAAATGTAPAAQGSSSSARATTWSTTAGRSGPSAGRFGPPAVDSRRCCHGVRPCRWQCAAIRWVLRQRHRRLLEDSRGHVELRSRHGRLDGARAHRRSAERCPSPRARLRPFGQEDDPLQRRARPTQLRVRSRGQHLGKVRHFGRNAAGRVLHVFRGL